MRLLTKPVQALLVLEAISTLYNALNKLKLNIVDNFGNAVSTRQRLTGKAGVVCLSSIKQMAKTVKLTETDNQAYFDKNKAREKTCAGWLKEQSKAVRKPILFAAMAGIVNGLGVIVQSALLAFILQAAHYRQAAVDVFDYAIHRLGSCFHAA